MNDEVTNRAKQTRPRVLQDTRSEAVAEEGSLAIGPPIGVEDIPEPRSDHLQKWLEICRKLKENEAHLVQADDVTARHSIHKLRRRGLIGDDIIITTRKYGSLVYIARLPADPAERERVAAELGYGRWTRRLSKRSLRSRR